jgi:membrane protease YdiL (CAAX protease family)
MGITAGEAVVRRRVESRSKAWLIAYSLLAGATLLDTASRHRGRGGRRGMWLGIPLVLAGYPIGCALLGHKPNQPPPDSLELELAALAGVLAPAEELTWGRRVEPRIGILMTSLLFAAKHVAIDGKWRRMGGLALFWFGLGLVRRRSPGAALALHMTANASGVVAGHLLGRDSF